MNTFEMDKAYVAGTYGRFPVEIVSGKGSVVTDAQGKEYIDMGTGIAVNTFGLCDEAWIAAVSEQLGCFQHTSNLYYTRPCAELAQELCERTGMKKVFFGNSGAEANECAIKVARKYAAEKHGSERCVILTLCNSFHGRTLATLAATGQEVFHKLFQPLPEGFVSVPANDLQAVREAVAGGRVAGILMEVVQGEGGVLPLTKEFAQGVEAICREQDIVLMIDEVQTGNGRTGELYGYMALGLHPDVVTTAKGLGGGLPIGCAMLAEKVQDVLGPGDHGSTFGGNPIACAGALNILRRIDDALLTHVRAMSKIVFDTLQGQPGIRSVSGMGLMIGIETEKNARDVVAACREMGVLVLTAKTKVRLLPALNIPEEQLRKALAVILQAAAV